jgi:hypothetical protein
MCLNDWPEQIAHAPGKARTILIVNIEKEINPVLQFMACSHVRKATARFLIIQIKKKDLRAGQKRMKKLGF